jgi:hypothetical protein
MCGQGHDVDQREFLKKETGDQLGIPKFHRCSMNLPDCPDIRRIDEGNIHK